LDAALSPGLDVLDVRVAAGGGSLTDRLTVSRWLVELPGVSAVRLADAVAAFLAADEVMVERLTKQGWRRFDARGAVVSLELVDPALGAAGHAPRGERAAGHAHGAPRGEQGAVPDTAAAVECAMMEAVVRQVAPAVRPDDVLAGLRVVAGLESPVPPRVTRLAQGTLTPHGAIADPLEDDGEVAELAASATVRAALGDADADVVG
jgi:hypothetical protein